MLLTTYLSVRHRLGLIDDEHAVTQILCTGMQSQLLVVNLPWLPVLFDLSSKVIKLATKEMAWLAAGRRCQICSSEKPQ